MSERFAPVAGRLAGIAGRCLGWRPDEFWHATPAELAAVLAQPVGDSPAPFGRDELRRLMEQHHD